MVLSLKNCETLCLSINTLISVVVFVNFVVDVSGIVISDFEVATQGNSICNLNNPPNA